MTVATAQSLTSLAARLTRPEDRETYAGLITYFESLPANDEMFHFVELLGLLTLLGQRIPDAAADLLVDLRAMDKRLAWLPGEISAGVDVAAIANGMGEAFRQQLRATGLQESAVLLRGASKDINALTSEISESLKPAAREYETIASTMAAEVGKLIDASRDLELHNARLIERDRKRDWAWIGTMGLVLLLVGMLGGIALEKRQSTDAQPNISTRTERIQTPAPSPVAGLRKKR